MRSQWVRQKIIFIASLFLFCALAAHMYAGTFKMYTSVSTIMNTLPDDIRHIAPDDWTGQQLATANDTFTKSVVGLPLTYQIKIDHIEPSTDPKLGQYLVHAREATIAGATVHIVAYIGLYNGENIADFHPDDYAFISGPITSCQFTRAADKTTLEVNVNHSTLMKSAGIRTLGFRPRDARSLLVNGSLDLLKLTKPDHDTIQGKFTLADDGLTNTGTSILQLQYTPPEEYDYHIQFVFKDNVDSVVQMLSVHGTPFIWMMGNDNGFVCRFNYLRNNDDAKLSVRLGAPMKAGQVYDCVVQVRKDGVSASINGMLLKKWATDYSDIGFATQWRLHGSSFIGLGVNNATVTFKAADIKPFGTAAGIVYQPYTPFIGARPTNPTPNPNSVASSKSDSLFPDTSGPANTPPPTDTTSATSTPPANSSSTNTSQITDTDDPDYPNSIHIPCAPRPATPTTLPAAPSDPTTIERPEFNNIPKPLVKSLSSITTMAVYIADDGDETGTTGDLIAIVPAESRHGATAGIGFTRGDGDDMMKTALDEAVRAVALRYPLWEPGHIELSFGEKFEKHGGPSAGTACGLLMLSILEGFTIDPKCAVTGDITVDWKVRKVGGVSAKLRGATLDKCLYAAIPEDNAEAFTDMGLLYGHSAYWKLQVFSIATLQDAQAVARKERTSDLAQAISLFSALAKKLDQGEMAALRDPDTKTTLQKILDLAPNHLSAQNLLALADGSAAKTLSANATLYHLSTIFYPYRVLLQNNKHVDPDTLNQMTIRSRKQFNLIRPIANPDVKPLLTAMTSWLESQNDFAADRIDLDTLKSHNATLQAAFDNVYSDPQMIEKLVHEGY